MGYFRQIPPRLRGGDALWSGKSPASVLLGAEFFGGPAGAVTGSLAVREAAADNVASVGTVRVTGALAAADGGRDVVEGAGRVALRGQMLARDTGGDDALAAGAVEVRGQVVVLEVGRDVLVGDGRAGLVTGAMASRDAGADLALIAGFVAGQARRAGPRRVGHAAPQFVRASPAVARRFRPPNYRRSP